MNDKTGGHGGPKRAAALRRAAALTAVATVAVLATACGMVHVHISSSAGSSSAGSPTYAQVLALAQCMRSHGVPNFPSPGQSAASPKGALPSVNSPQYLSAAGACQHLLPPGAKVSISTSTRQSSSAS